MADWKQRLALHKPGTLPYYAAMIVISGAAAFVTAMLTAPAPAGLLIGALTSVTFHAVHRILRMLEAAVRHIDAYEKREAGRG